MLIKKIGKEEIEAEKMAVIDEIITVQKQAFCINA